VKQINYLPCDLCGSATPRHVLESGGLDGPLVECTACGLRYVGRRERKLTFGDGNPYEIAQKVKAANSEFRHLRLEEEHRLALLNAKWRLDLIKNIRPAGKLLEIGCARGDFLNVARESFDVHGVEPNPELAVFAKKFAPVYEATIEHTPWFNFDIITSFHVIEHVESPRSFVRAAAERLKPGGLLVLETPNINSAPYKILKSRWRQFIPEHYFFFSQRTIEKLLAENGLKMQQAITIGKYASMELLLNRLSRYLPWLPGASKISRLTFRINPLDIMLVFAQAAV
jgi:2-polyprenyl-3-methyl-5-hydroxy-6-metoxy-1,4-benzoquinol methylase